MRLLYIMRGARPKCASYNACIGGACPKYAPRIFYVGTTPSRPQVMRGAYGAMRLLYLYIGGAYQNVPPICRLCEAHIKMRLLYAGYARPILSPQNMRLLYVMRGAYWAPKICASYIVWILTFLKFEFWLFFAKKVVWNLKRL